MNSPCKDCPDRRSGCHDEEVCEKWGVFQNSLQQMKEERRREWIVADYIGRSIFRRRKENSQAIRRALSQR